ncbi:MAG TPA: MaoC/PaaZ C-terminal domain-containing protein [Longimicrobiaceae bacterium]|nr:MaoC/PaaZ C-terminal domain-containing protein [Longimicrobiaceae bacterium]
MTRGADALLAMARLAARGLRSPKPGASPSPAPRRRIAVERRDVAPAPERLTRYLRATDGTRIAAFRGAEARLPPLYSATWETSAALELLAQLAESLPSVGGVVHLESEVVPLRPLRPGDRVRCRLELERVDETPRGARVQVAARSWNGAEQLCSQGSAVFLVRTRERPPAGGGGRPRDREPEPPPAGEGWAEVARWRLGSGAGRRYALASGDFNPIHLWGWTARPFGFPRPILHGFCTAAMVAHALVEHRLGGDPGALRRLRIAFRAPLLLPARVRLLAGEEGGRHAFRVTDEEGARTFAEGDFAGE